MGFPWCHNVTTMPEGTLDFRFTSGLVGLTNAAATSGRSAKLLATAVAT